MVDKRKGMTVAKLDLEIKVDKELTDNPRGIYVVEYRFDWGRDGAYASGTTVYCNIQHDMSINMIMNNLGLNNKRIKRIELIAKKNVGESVAVAKEIKRWRIT